MFKIWDIESNLCIKTLMGHTEKVYNIQVVSSNFILSASDDKTFKLWNIKDGECVNTINAGTNDIKYLNLFYF